MSEPYPELLGGAYGASPDLSAGTGPPAGSDLAQGALNAGVDPDDPDDPRSPIRISDLTRRLVDYRIKMTPERRKRLAANLCRQVEEYWTETEDRRDNLKQWRRDYAQMPVGGSRWPGSSDINAPLTQIYAEKYARTMSGAIANTDPVVAAETKTPSLAPILPLVEEAMAGFVTDAQWQAAVYETSLELAISGNVAIKVEWVEDWVRRPEPQVEMIMERLNLLLESGAEPLEAYVSSVQLDRDGFPGVELGFVDDLAYAGPRLTVIPFQDLLVLPATVRGPEHARGIGERFTCTGAELAAGVRQGKYLDAEVKKVYQAGADPVSQDRSEQLETVGMDAEGRTEDVDEGSHDFDYYELVELCYQGDWNGDGVTEWGVFTLHPASETLIRAHYMPYEHGESYYTLFRMDEQSGILFGMGISERVAGFQAAYTAILNQWLDNGDALAASAFSFFFERGMGMDPGEFVLAPGKPIPVDNVEGIRPIPVTPLPPEMLQLLLVIRELAELSTGANSVNLGKETETRKTLGEVRMVQQQSGQIFESSTLRVARQWVRPLNQFRWLLAQFGSPGNLRYRRTPASAARFAADRNRDAQASGGVGPMSALDPEAQYGSIPADLLRAAVSIVPSVLAEAGDANSRLQRAETMQAIFMQHPLTAQNPEVLMIALDHLMQSARYPVRAQITAAVQRQVAAEQQAQQQAAMLALLTGQAQGEQDAGAQGQAQAQQDEERARQQRQESRDEQSHQAAMAESEQRRAVSVRDTKRKYRGG